MGSHQHNHLDSGSNLYLVFDKIKFFADPNLDSRYNLNTITVYIPKYSLQNNTSTDNNVFGETCNHFVCNIGQPCKMHSPNEAPTEFQNSAFPAFDEHGYQEAKEKQSNSAFGEFEYQKEKVWLWPQKAPGMCG